MPTTTSAPHGLRVHATELATWMTADDAPRVLDVRTPAEYESVHIPGSWNVPLDTLREHRGELVRHLADDVVFVCRSGMRAEQAELAFAEAGMPNVHVLEGGIDAWISHDGEIRRGHQQWAIDRQVRFVAGTLVLAGGLGSLLAPRLRWLATAVGGGLAFSALTDTCAMGAALSKLPFNQGAASCDIDAVIRELSPDEPTAVAAADADDLDAATTEAA